MYLLGRLPLHVYYETLLPNITTRNDILPRSNGSVANPPFSWPSTFSYDPYLSLLPTPSLNIDKALNDRLVRPIDSGYMCSDTAVDKMIYLVVHRGHGGHVTARDRHWAIRWTVFSRGSHPIQYLRNLELRSNEAYPGNANYLINYGPFTSADRVTSFSGVRVIELGVLTLEQRRLLEAIAWNVGVVQPNGDFNCQNWVAAVLSVAVARGLFKEDTIRAALNKGLQEYVNQSEYVQVMPRGF